MFINALTACIVYKAYKFRDVSKNKSGDSIFSLLSRLQGGSRTVWVLLTKLTYERRFILHFFN